MERLCKPNHLNQTFQLTLSRKMNFGTRNRITASAPGYHQRRSRTRATRSRGLRLSTVAKPTTNPEVSRLHLHRWDSLECSLLRVINPVETRLNHLSMHSTRHRTYNQHHHGLQRTTLIFQFHGHTAPKTVTSLGLALRISTSTMRCRKSCAMLT